METNKVYQGNNIDVLKTFPDNSIDSIVTDPPYGINFMGKKWDYDVPSVDTWKECLRVLKPGGHILVACGTRTQHRMAVNIEDAGFEIRDIVAWVYGSGFPKSMDISKQIDKINGENGRRHKFTAWMRKTGITASQLDKVTNSFMGSHYLTDKDQAAIPTREMFEKMRPLFKTVPIEIERLIDREEAEREIIGKGQAGFLEKNNSFEINNEGYGNYDITAPSTDQAKQWQGWGTALKPAMELWTLARKPLKGTVAENVLKYGTGGINVDGCRVGDDEISVSGKGSFKEWQKEVKGFKSNEDGVNTTHYGRFPANVIHDGSDEVVALFPNDGDVSAARFFYTAKAQKSERNMGLYGFEEGTTDDGRKKSIDNAFQRGKTKRRNVHPTVKPLDLMRYLCRLITPPNGICLDPFLGSGTTAVAAKLEGFQYIGIEMEEEYCKIAEARIAECDKDYKTKAEALKDDHVAEVYDIFDFLKGDDSK